ncbi:hypothetical protein L208DRAFT_785558 [Tricholoma matsutake]|nr:hypothetical protein L208DRAFT_785558 [Tricholoma matsutake 945]
MRRLCIVLTGFSLPVQDVWAKFDHFTYKGTPGTGLVDSFGLLRKLKPPSQAKAAKPGRNSTKRRLTVSPDALTQGTQVSVESRSSCNDVVCTHRSQLKMCTDRDRCMRKS